MEDQLQQLVELEQQALEYYRDADYSGVVCSLTKAMKSVGLYTKVVPKDKGSYLIHVAGEPITVINEWMVGVTVRVYKVGRMQRAIDALLGCNQLPEYHICKDSILVEQPCTIRGAVATVQASLEQ